VSSFSKSGRYSQSEFHRNIVKSARSEAAIEMPQSRNDHSDDRNLDVGPRLIEDEEVEARARGDVDAGVDMLARVCREGRTSSRSPAWNLRMVTRRQKGIVLQPQWSGAVEARFLAGSASHEADRQELVQFGQCAQQRNALIEVRARNRTRYFLGRFASNARSPHRPERRDRW